MTPSPTKTASSDLGSAGSALPPTAMNTFYLKITAKKDSTETMVKSLVSRTHVPKPISYTLKQHEKNTECFLKYPSMEVAQEVQAKISGEKINGAAFDTETLDVEPQPDEENEEFSPPAFDENQTDSNMELTTLSKDAIRSIAEMLKQNQNPKRKQVTLNISPRGKQKRHQRMKTGSKQKRKTKRHSTSSESDTSHGGHDDQDVLDRVKNILSQEPIAVGAATASKGKSFDPHAGMPSKPSKVLKEKTKNLLKTIQISSSDDQQDPDQITSLLNMVLKNQKKHQKKKKSKKNKYSSSSDSSDSSSSDSLNNSSTSDDSPSKMRRKLKKLQKKGKLRSGRHRKGLAVIRNEIWPHDGINARLAGKNFPTIESLTPMAFVAGILNSILDSEDFRKLEKKKFAPKMRQRFKTLNELVHGIIRSQNFPEVRDFYLSTLEEIETGQGSWKDEEYWMTQMVLFRTVLRTAPPQRQPLIGGVRRNGDPANPGLQPRDCCHQFNNDGCSKESPHPNNDPTRSPDQVHHFCKICLRKNIKKAHAAKACKGGSAGQQ